MDRKGGNIGWFVTLAVIITTFFCVTITHYVKEYAVTRKVKELSVGDTFTVRYVSENPYEDDMLFGGVIVAKSGNYIRYATFGGDTTSTNIRDVYRFPETFKITITKPDKHGK